MRDNQGNQAGQRDTRFKEAAVGKLIQGSGMYGINQNSFSANSQGPGNGGDLDADAAPVGTVIIRCLERQTTGQRLLSNSGSCFIMLQQKLWIDKKNPMRGGKSSSPLFDISRRSSKKMVVNARSRRDHTSTNFSLDQFGISSSSST